MIVSRKYEDIMDESKSHQMRARLGERTDAKAKEEIRDYALYYHKDIVEILDLIKRELLLILKTNNYLRAIDKRLGNPNNTYNTINNTTWRVYTRELASMDRIDYIRECWKYYTLKFFMALYLMRIRFLGLFGVKACKEELEDFDLDYNE